MANLAGAFAYIPIKTKGLCIFKHFFKKCAINGDL